jgi:hypothetical protein
VVRHDIRPSRSRADFADNPVAAFAYAASAAAAHAGLLDNWRSAIVVNRKAFAENHLNSLFARLRNAGRRLSTRR